MMNSLLGILEQLLAADVAVFMYRKVTDPERLPEAKWFYD